MLLRSNHKPRLAYKIFRSSQDRSGASVTARAVRFVKPLLGRRMATLGTKVIDPPVV